VRSCHDPPASASAGRRISRARQDDEDLVVLVDVLLAAGRTAAAGLIRRAGRTTMTGC
jgi:hypothetical protein